MTFRSELLEAARALLALAKVAKDKPVATAKAIARELLGHRSK